MSYLNDLNVSKRTVVELLSDCVMLLVSFDAHVSNICGGMDMSWRNCDINLFCWVMVSICKVIMSIL